MQCIGSVYKMKLKSSMLILLWTLLLIPELSFGEKFNKADIYFEVLGGHSENLIRNNISKFSIDGQPISYKNNKNFDGTNMHVGTGYQWKINNKWSWNTGGRLGYNKFSVKGKGEIVGLNPSKYKYKISVHDFAIINRLVYTQKQWKYYGALSLGLSNLKSYNYSNIIEDYKNKIIKKPFYSISLGVLSHLDKNIDLGMDIGCTDFNTTKLGRRIDDDGNSIATTGSIKQKLRMINIDVSFIYQF